MTCLLSIIASDVALLTSLPIGTTANDIGTKLKSWPAERKPMKSNTIIEGEQETKRCAPVINIYLYGTDIRENYTADNDAGSVSDAIQVVKQVLVTNRSMALSIESL